MSLGAARAGFTMTAGADLDKKALSAHAKNFPSTKHLELDLANASGSDILGSVDLRKGELDTLVGGPPCQGFSTIGKRNLEDLRNNRLFDFFRLVSEILPRAFVVENVPGLLHPQYKGALDDALKLVAKQYEVLEPHLLRATDVGAPTIRRRVLIVGFRRPHKPPPDFWKHTDGPLSAPSVRTALHGLPLDPKIIERGGISPVVRVKIQKSGHFFEKLVGCIPEDVGDPDSLAAYRERRVVTGFIGTKHSSELEARYGALEFGSSDRKTKSVRLDPNGYCPTLRAGTGPERGSFQAVRPIHYLRPRVITPREAARLQGFPDWFQFDDTKWHSFRQIGNSVSPFVSEFIMKKVAESLNA